MDGRVEDAGSVREAKLRWQQARNAHPRGCMLVHDAWIAWVAEAYAAGEPLDRLRIDSRNETERFFARTVPGPDGHVYWVGGRDFTGNTSRTRPRHWWWRQIHGPSSLARGDAVRPHCGDARCINPEHCNVQARRERCAKFSDAQMLGFIQVAALRLGHRPTKVEFDSMKLGISTTAMFNRFGSWTETCRRAGV